MSAHSMNAPTRRVAVIAAMPSEIAAEAAAEAALRELRAG